MQKDFFKSPEQVREWNEAQVPLWFWNDRLKRDELVRQMSIMSEKGITCSAPHARSGFEGGYLDDAWMEHIKTVIEYKTRHSETMWLYDEFNWPAGIANGQVTRHEAFREKYLSIQMFHVGSGVRFRRQPEDICRTGKTAPDDPVRDREGRRSINNLFCYDAKTMEPLDIRQFQPDDKSRCLFNLSENDFEICRDRDTIVFEARIQTELYQGEGMLTPDYLNKEATEYFLETTYEAYYKRFPDAFGSVITASFNDETRFCHAFPWTDRLLELFEERFGYRLEERLPDLVLPGCEAGRTRCDYFQLISDLYREHYHRTIREWCEAHNIDYCPHLLGEETMAGQVRFSGDFMRQFREFGRPGVDHLGKGIGSLNIKFAASAAEVYGKSGLVCEAFAASGWELTFEEYIRMISWLYSQGVMTITNHGFFYSIRGFRKDDWPPSQFFQWQEWEHMDQANRMCRRIYGMTEDCRRKTDVLIYHPTESYWMHYIADQGFRHGYHMGPVIEDERAAAIDREEQCLLHKLQEKNRDFTMVPSDAAELFDVKDKMLVNRITGQSYQAFILPMCEVLPQEMARLLETFAGRGGRIAVVESVPAYGGNRKEDETVKRCVNHIMESSQTEFFEAMDGDQICKWLDQACPRTLKIVAGPAECRKNIRHYPDWISDPYIHTGEDMDGISWCLFEGNERKYYFINYTKEIQNLVVDVKAGKHPEIWDPFTGRIEPADVVSEAESEWGHGFRINMELPQGYGIFLVTSG